MDKKSLTKVGTFVLKVAVTVLLVYLISRKIDFAEVKNTFLNSNPWFLLLGLSAFGASQVVGSWRLLSFLREIGMPVQFGYNFRLYLLGLFYNVFLPGGIGGDGFKVYILRKKFQLPTKRIILALLLDRVSGVWGIGLLCVILVILIPKIEIPATLPVLALIAGTIIYYFGLLKFFPDYAKAFFSKHIKAAIVQSLQLVTVICILLSQGFSGKFSPYLFSFLVSSLATVIPVSFGGFGLREYVMTHASGVFDMNQSLAVFVTLTFLILSTIAALPGIYFVYRSTEFANPPTEEEAKAFEEQADKTIDKSADSL